MKIRVLCCGAALSLAASHAAACNNPPLAKVPTLEEVENLEQQLPEIQSSVEEYHAAMEAYTECLQSEVDEARENGAPELAQTLLVQRNNAAVAEVEAVLQQFNQLVQEARGGTQIEQQGSGGAGGE